MKPSQNAMRLIAGVVACWVNAPLLAAPPVDLAKKSPTIDPPIITAGPPELVSAMRGDIIKLKIEFKSNKSLVPQIKWVIRSQSLVCRDATCTLKTSGIAPGNHAVYIVVFDDAGSDSTKFNLRVDDPVRGKNPKEIDVPAGQLTEGQKETPEDRTKNPGGFLSRHSISAITGRAYSHNRSVIHVIGRETETIAAADSLRTSNPGLLTLKLTGSDETWLLEGSMARLAGTNKGRGLLRLERGIVRSRTLSNRDPGWDISSGGFVFRGDGKQDIVVQRLPGDEILVTALRGPVRIHKEATYKGNADENIFFKITQGSIIRLKVTKNTAEQDPTRPQIAGSPAERDAVAAIIRTTTPQYLTKRDVTDQEKFPFIRNRSPGALNDAVKSARIALNQSDPWLAIEPLLYRLDEATKDQDACYLIGRSYVEMLLLPEGEEWLQKAIAGPTPGNVQTPSAASDNAQIMLGILNYKKKSWSAAAAYFTSANLDAWLKEPDLSGERAYMVGKSCALGEYRHCAKVYLSRAANDRMTVEGRNEARILLKKIDVLPGSTWSSSMHFGYNSNIFGLKSPSNKVALPAGVTHNQTGFAVGSLGLASRGSASDELPQDDQDRGGIEFKLNLQKSMYVNSDLSNYGVSTYAGQLGIFYTRASRKADSEDASGSVPFMDLGLNAYMIMGGIGSQRVHDEAGAGMRLSLPWLLGTELAYQNGRAVDPQPSLEHEIDYLTGERSGTADDTANISRFILSFVPFGPTSLTGEAKGSTNVALEGESITASRSAPLDGTGAIHMLNVKMTMARKVLDRATLRVLAGADTLTRNINSEDSEALGSPAKQTKITLGLNYEHALTPFLIIDLATNQGITTTSPSTIDSFSRTMVTVGARIDF